MKALSTRILTLIDAVDPVFAEVGEHESVQPLLAGGWSRKQVVGHLIDSASNNHQRFIRASLQSSLDFPGYDQDSNVRIQHFQQAPWPLLVELWHSYNQFLAHLIAYLPETKFKTECRIGEGEPVTLEFLVNDYVAHLAHHLQQMGITTGELEQEYRRRKLQQNKPAPRSV